MLEQLFEAIREGDSEKVGTLITMKVAVNGTSSRREDATPLMFAVFSGQVEIANQLLEAGADPNLADSRGRTALHFITACGGSSGIMASSLINYHADLDLKDVDGDTPLHYAAVIKDLPGMRVLLRRGADVELTNDYACTPLNAIGFELDERTPIDETHQAQIYEAATLLLNHHADPNSQDENGDTPLHWATRHNHEALVYALLVDEADASVENEHGKRPRAEANPSAAGTEAQEAILWGLEREEERYGLFSRKKPRVGPEQLQPAESDDDNDDTAPTEVSDSSQESSTDTETSDDSLQILSGGPA